jgi:selenophosphate synthetase-related protein
MKKGEDAAGRYGGLIEKHVKSIEWIREELLEMDSLIHPVMGIASWDDSVVVDFGNKRLVASVDGPYKKRLVMKSALIHSATDVVVKGARPLFALDTVTGSEKTSGR